MKIIHVHFGWRNEYRSNPCSYEHYWTLKYRPEFFSVVFIAARINCFYIHVFNISAHIWFSYIYSHYSPLQRFIWIQHNDQLPVGLLAQLVEHCTSITEVMGSNSIWAWIFSGLILTTSSVVFIAQGSLLYSNVELFCQRRLILSFRFPFRHTNTRRNIN